MFKPRFENYIDIINHQCQQYTGKDLYVFFADGEEKIEKLTYLETLTKLQIIAANLQAVIKQNDKVLILCPPGIEFNLSFLGCLFAGAIPVPLYPPDTRSLDRVINITNDCCAKMAIANKSTIDKLLHGLTVEDNSFLHVLKNVRLIDSEEIQEDNGNVYMPFIPHPMDTAYLQYTSGSTSKPKGVMVTHKNLVFNTCYIAEYFRQTDEEYMVSWIPPFHDMGLIKDLMTTIYTGSTLVFMSPYSFLRKPLRWLKHITNYGTLGPVIAGGPNFAYDLCTNIISDNERTELNLSHWRVAYNGSEPVRASTLDAFYKKFSVCGFQKKALEPVYGLAEGTLMVGAPIFGKEPVIQHIDKEAYKQNTVKFIAEDSENSMSIACCGKIIEEQETLIVNPDTLTICKDEQVGEIWIKGPSITAGYYNNKEETEKTFQAYLADSRGPYLRTGDLGFISNHHIYITGRLKDLIIMNGYNHYPQDLELTAASSHDSLRANNCIAFSIQEDNTEKLVMVCEIKRSALNKVDLKHIKEQIKQSVFQFHGIPVYKIVFIESSTIPKTSSGKLQRKLCKKQFFEDSLKKIENAVKRQKISV